MSIYFACQKYRARYQQSTTHPMFQVPQEVTVASEPSLVATCRAGFFNLYMACEVEPWLTRHINVHVGGHGAFLRVIFVRAIEKLY